MYVTACDVNVTCKGQVLAGFHPRRDPATLNALYVLGKKLFLYRVAPNISLLSLVRAFDP